MEAKDNDTRNKVCQIFGGYIIQITGVLLIRIVLKFKMKDQLLLKKQKYKGMRTAIKKRGTFLITVNRYRTGN